jgi:hypothetical protein
MPGVRRLRHQTEVTSSYTRGQKHHERRLVALKGPPNNSLQRTAGQQVSYPRSLAAAAEFGRYAAPYWGSIMSLKDVPLFIIVCGLDGICIFLGSVLGNSMGRTGLFAGAVVGGIIGVAAALLLAARLKLLDRASYGAAFLGGVVGFGIAAVIAVKNLHGPLIPVASVGLVGLGSIIGKVTGRKRAA